MLPSANCKASVASGSRMSSNMAPAFSHCLLLVGHNSRMVVAVSITSFFSKEQQHSATGSNKHHRAASLYKTIEVLQHAGMLHLCSFGQKKVYMEALFTFFDGYQVLSPDERASLIPICTAFTMRKGEHIQPIGKTCKTIYFIQTGLARVYYLKSIVMKRFRAFVCSSITTSL